MSIRSPLDYPTLLFGLVTSVGRAVLPTALYRKSLQLFGVSLALGIRTASKIDNMMCRLAGFRIWNDRQIYFVTFQKRYGHHSG